MNSQDIWIRDGRVVTRPMRRDGSALSNRQLMERQAMVRVSFNHTGSVIEWVSGQPNWSSLMITQSFLPALVAPYTLKFYNDGWFTEKFETVAEAVHRIEGVMYKSDIRLSDHVFTSDSDVRESTLSQELQHMLTSGTTPDNRSIICNVAPEHELSKIEHIGENSLIGQIWGVTPNSFPFQSGNSYDRTVTPFYFKAANTGKPHFDHVLASMVRPDGERHWFGYHRVIIPEIFQGRRRVRVVSELAPVDIQVM